MGKELIRCNDIADAKSKFNSDEGAELTPSMFADYEVGKQFTETLAKNFAGYNKITTKAGKLYKVPCVITVKGKHIDVSSVNDFDGLTEGGTVTFEITEKVIANPQGGEWRFKEAKKVFSEVAKETLTA